MTHLLDLPRVRDFEGRGAEIWVRRFLVLLLAVVPLLALINVFGQKSSDAVARSDVATLTVHSPQRLRGGLLFEARFTIEAHQQIKQATLSLSRDWADGLTINTLEPSPQQETSDNGELTLQFGELKPGQTFVFHMQFQVNPTTVGNLTQQVALLDDDKVIVSLTRHVTVLP